MITKSLLFALLTFGIAMIVALFVAVIIKIISKAVQREKKSTAE